MRAAAGSQNFETGAVVALTHEGDGIVREGKAVFVPGALPGELIRYQRGARHRQHDAGTLLEVLQSSPERVRARCAHFGICGGCALQHLVALGTALRQGAASYTTILRASRVPPRAGGLRP